MWYDVPRFVLPGVFSWLDSGYIFLAEISLSDIVSFLVHCVSGHVTVVCPRTGDKSFGYLAIFTVKLPNYSKNKL